MKKRVILFLLTVSILVGTVAAVPTWRGDPGTTYQRWDFTNGDNPAVAENVDNPYALGSPITADVTGTDLDYDCVGGVWSGSYINFRATIPNTSNTAPDSYKNIIIEIGYRGDISLILVTANGEVEGSIQEIDTYTDSTGEIWNIGRYYYHIEPNPTSEDLCIGFSSFALPGQLPQLQELDYVMVDTICAVPAPGAILLGGLGAGLVGWFKRRKM